eukprot:g111.t1
MMDSLANYAYDAFPRKSLVEKFIYKVCNQDFLTRQKLILQLAHMRNKHSNLNDSYVGLGELQDLKKDGPKIFSYGHSLRDSKFQSSLLILAAKLHDSYAVGVLLSLGFDPMVQDINGDTFLHHAIRDNFEDVVMEALKHGSAENLKCIENNKGETSLSLSQFCSLKIFALQEGVSEGHDWHYVVPKTAPKEFKNVREIVLEAAKRLSGMLNFASIAFKNDHEIVLEAVKKYGLALQYVPQALKKDRKFVLEAVKSDGLALEIVFEAVKPYGFALKYTSEKFQKDRKIVFEAVKRYAVALQYASEELKKDREIVFKAVKPFGLALQYASEELKKDREIVFEAVKRYGRALQYASEELKKDREIVFEAVKRYGRALQYASEELKNDCVIVLEAVKRDGHALEYASKELKKDYLIVLEAVKNNVWALEYASEELRNDGGIVNEILHSEAHVKAAKALRDELPGGYTFSVPPTQTQLLVASRLKEEGCPGLGNWSWTGSGKTMSAILSMAHLRCRTTVVICPLSVVLHWRRQIDAAFSGVFEVVVLEKLPSDGKVNWETEASPRVVIINYAKLSQQTSEDDMYSLLTEMNGSMDMIVLDEMHKVKLRNNHSSGHVEATGSGDEESAHGKEIDEQVGGSIETEMSKLTLSTHGRSEVLKQKNDIKMSKRRKVVLNFVSQARKANTKLRTLGLTATPVVNSLKEAISLLCIVSGKDFSHLNCPTYPTQDDLVAVHRELHIYGVGNWNGYWDNMGEGLVGVNEQIEQIEIDATLEYMDIQKRKPNTYRVESALARTKAKLGRIVKECLACKARNERVLIYTHTYGGGVLEILHRGLKDACLRVCTYIGDNAKRRESNKHEFIDGCYDVMIGSQVVATGVDGFQYGCHTMIINLLPMTNAEYTQLKGRLLRIGQGRSLNDLHSICLLLLGCCPGESFSKVLCYFANGNQAMSIRLTYFTNLCCVFTLPLLQPGNWGPELRPGPSSLVSRTC